MREEVARFMAELEDSEAAVERLVIARETVVEVLAQPVLRGPDMPVTCGHAAPSKGGAVARSVVPHWCEDLAVAVLAPDYRRIMMVLESQAALGRDGVRAQELAGTLGLAVVPAKVEGVRSKLESERRT